jgi:hypothetical protein
MRILGSNLEEDSPKRIISEAIHMGMGIAGAYSIEKITFSGSLAMCAVQASCLVEFAT